MKDKSKKQLVCKFFYKVSEEVSISSPSYFQDLFLKDIFKGVWGTKNEHF